MLNKFLRIVEVDATDYKQAFKDLMKISPEKFAQLLPGVLKEFVYFGVVKKDGTFFTEEPEAVFKKKTFSTSPYMIGVNSTEGSGILAVGKEQGFDRGIAEKPAREVLKGILGSLVPGEKYERLEKEVIKEYGRGIDREKDAFFWSRIIGEVKADQYFVINSLKTAAIYADAVVPTYFYYMTQRTTYKHDAKYNKKENARLMSDICECDHFDDVTYTFGIPLSNAKLTFEVKFTEEEMKYSENWMKFIVNFANTGNPNQGPYKLPVHWPSYETRKYHEANSSSKIKENLKSDRLKFWSEIFPVVLKA